MADSSQDRQPFLQLEQLGARRRGVTIFVIAVMGDVNNYASRGPPRFEIGQGSSQPLITGPIRAPQFNFQMPENNAKRTPDNNVTQVNLGNVPLNLAQLSQFSPEQLKIVASFIQMLTDTPQPDSTPVPDANVGPHKRPPFLVSRNADGTPL